MAKSPLDMTKDTVTTDKRVARDDMPLSNVTELTTKKAQMLHTSAQTFTDRNQRSKDVPEEVVAEEAPAKKANKPKAKKTA